MSSYLRAGRNLDEKGSISPTYLRTAFMPVAPKSIRIWSSCQHLFMLFVSMCVKDVHKTLMKLSQGCQFHQHFMHAFFVRKQIEQLFSNYVWLCDFWRQNFIQKMRVDEIDGRVSILDGCRSSMRFSSKRGIGAKDFLTLALIVT